MAQTKSLASAGRLKGWDATVLQDDSQVILAQLPGSTTAARPMQLGGTAARGKVDAFPKP